MEAECPKLGAESPKLVSESREGIKTSEGTGSSTVVGSTKGRGVSKTPAPRKAPPKNRGVGSATGAREGECASMSVGEIVGAVVGCPVGRTRNFGGWSITQT